ncbi:MAG: hypothetical protein NC911_07510 [Candidatus Omnitrophica bacterium]|nr:hypothetical protein [Candidatus Omnitrophota bacterium]MCM8769495.1 hypothetical protein [Candidatus Omnitrophota bacterium]
MYRANLKLILNRLLTLPARVFWATTTRVHPDRPFSDAGWSWRNDEIDRYNAVASSLMEARGVPINDLHTLVWGNPAACSLFMTWLPAR